MRNPRAPMESEQVAYALTTRKANGGVAVEVLLQRRPSDASLMPEMLELPQIEVQGIQASEKANLVLQNEPVLRVRHSITGTNYYVEVLAVSAQRETKQRALRQHGLEWIALSRLHEQPLTGLARKVLQRLRLMKSPADERAPEVPLLIGRASRIATGKKA